MWHRYTPASRQSRDCFSALRNRSHGGCGTIVKITTAGSIKATHTFFCGTNGFGPVGPFVQTDDGMYGTTDAGGLFKKGTVFSPGPSRSATERCKSGRLFVFLLQHQQTVQPSFDVLPAKAYGATSGDGPGCA